MSGSNFNITTNKAANEDGSTPAGGVNSPSLPSLSPSLLRLTADFGSLQTALLTTELIIQNLAAGTSVLDVYATVPTAFSGAASGDTRGKFDGIKYQEIVAIGTTTYNVPNIP